MLSINLAIRNFDVLVSTVGSARHSVTCLGVWSSTVNNDPVSRLQICSPRCWAGYPNSSLELGRQLISSSEHIPNWSFKNMCFSRVHSWTESCKHWSRMYQLHTYRPFCCLLCWQLDDRYNRTRFAGHNQVITSQWICPQRSFPHWQGVRSWTQWPGRLLGMLTCRSTRRTSRDWSKCCLDTSIQRKYKIISGSNTTCEHELDIFIYYQKRANFLGLHVTSSKVYRSSC